MSEAIEIGYQTFLSDSTEAFGAIRAMAPSDGAVTVYVENAGDFNVPVDAVREVTSGKVTFDCNKLDPTLRRAIGHAHEAETE